MDHPKFGWLMCGIPSLSLTDQHAEELEWIVVVVFPPPEMEWPHLPLLLPLHKHHPPSLSPPFQVASLSSSPLLCSPVLPRSPKRKGKVPLPLPFSIGRSFPPFPAKYGWFCLFLQPNPSPSSSVPLFPFNLGWRNQCSIQEVEVERKTCDMHGRRHFQAEEEMEKEEGRSCECMHCAPSHIPDSESQM